MPVTSHIVPLAEVSTEERASELGGTEMWTKFWIVPTRAGAHTDTTRRDLMWKDDKRLLGPESLSDPH